MNPDKLGNVAVAVDEGLSNERKLNALSVESSSTLGPYKRLLDITKRAKRIAKDLARDNVDSTEGGDKTLPQTAYYKAPPVKVAKTPRGDLMLDIFIYSPTNWRWGRSVTASWHLKSGEQSRLVLQEHVSDKSLTPGIAAYREGAPRVLGLIDDSLRAYRAAQAEPAKPESWR